MPTSEPFQKASRDVISVQGGLHHLMLMEDLEKMLGEIHRVLKPDAILAAIVRFVELRIGWGKFALLGTRRESPLVAP